MRKNHIKQPELFGTRSNIQKFWELGAQEDSLASYFIQGSWRLPNLTYKCFDKTESRIRHKIPISLSVTNKEGCSCPGVGEIWQQNAVNLVLLHCDSLWKPEQAVGVHLCSRSIGHAGTDLPCTSVESWTLFTIFCLDLKVSWGHMCLSVTWISWESTDWLETGHPTWSMDPTRVPIYISLQLPSQP